MTIRTTWILSAFALAVSAGALAQTDRAFTATGASCSQVSWSAEALER
jgi:hypothetical protein